MKKILFILPLIMLVGCYNPDVEIIEYEPHIAEVDLSGLEHAYSLEKVYIEPAYGLSNYTPIQDLLNDQKYISEVYGEIEVIETEEHLKEYLDQQLNKYDKRIGILYKSSAAPAAVIEEKYEILMNTHDIISATLVYYEYGIEKTDDGFFISLENRFTTNNIELATINNKMDEFMQELNIDGLSETEIVEKIYSFVIDRMEYVDGGLDKHHSALGFVLDGEGVCQAYAVSMQMLLERVGIEARYIIGYTHPDEESPEPIGHAWNMVKLDGNWYHIDATWDDDSDRWSYFLVSDNIMDLSRTWETKYYESAPFSYVDQS